MSDALQNHNRQVLTKVYETIFRKQANFEAETGIAIYMDDAANLDSERWDYPPGQAQQTDVPVPIDDIEYFMTRYFFQVERGQNERLDRIFEWLNQVKPLVEQTEPRE